MVELCRNPRLKADVMLELETVAERAGLQRFEKVSAGRVARTKEITRASHLEYMVLNMGIQMRSRRIHSVL